MSAQAAAEADDRSPMQRADDERRLEDLVVVLRDQRDEAVELLAAIDRAGYLDLAQGDVARNLRRTVRKLVRDVGPTELYERHEARIGRSLPVKQRRHAILNAVLAELLSR